MTWVDADGCPLTVGLTSWLPWRWAHTYMSSGGTKENRAARIRCRLHGQKGLMKDPETGEKIVDSTAELPFGTECCPTCLSELDHLGPCRCIHDFARPIGVV